MSTPHPSLAPYTVPSLSSLGGAEDEALEAVTGHEVDFGAAGIAARVRLARAGLGSDAFAALDRGEREAALDALVEDINQAGVELGFAAPGVKGYDPDIYAAVFLHVMRRRHCLQLSIDQIFKAGARTEDKPYAALTASSEDVDRAYVAAEAIPEATRERRVTDWYR